MFLVGDSHTRSYATSEFLSPVFFLSNGKRINLSGLIPFARLLYYCLVAGRSARKNNDTYAIIVGEPDLRRMQYNGWELHDGEITVPTSRLEILWHAFENAYNVPCGIRFMSGTHIGVGTQILG